MTPPSAAGRLPHTPPNAAPDGPPYIRKGPRHRARLFVTCVVDQLFPEVGVAAVRVLRALGDEVEFDPDQTCCGQPAFNSGYWDEARTVARRLLGQYDDSAPVVIPSGSCAAMIRNYYAELFADDPVNLARARRLRRRVYEFTEYVAEFFDTDQIASVLDDSPDGGESEPVSVAFHEACHAKRELGVDAQPKAILDALPGVRRADLPQAEVCCGFGGTFSVKYPDISGAMLRDKLDGIEASGADLATACDASCLMHIRGGLRRRESRVQTAHIAELIARNLREGSR